MFTPKLQKTVDALISEFASIPPGRKMELGQLTAFIQQALHNNAPVNLNFICTHNSRRSHMAQIWAQAAAAHYGIPGIQTFSGGTEATAFNPRAVAALARLGFETIKTSESENPIYHVRFGKDAETMAAFSKLYSDSPNPKDHYCAVMTCSQADDACPVVLGASARVALPYDDPKLADDTPQEAHKYDERARQIGREMLYAFSRVKQP